MKSFSPLTLSLAIAAMGGVAAGAHAKAPVTQELQQAMARSQQLAKQAATTGAVDKRAPVLTAFNAGTAVDARQASATLPIELSFSDNLSGLAYFYIEARSPSGQTQLLERRLDFATRKQAFSLGMELSSLSEPGNWQITYLYAHDLAGNDLSLGQTALAALGSTQFTVTNTVYDVTPPKLVAGQILTPRFAPTQPAKGVAEGGAKQTAGVALAVTDGGGPANAGVKVASLTFCGSGDGYYCYASFTIRSDNGSARPGDASSRLVLGGLNDGYYYYAPSPGIYSIEYVTLTDFAGNSATYRSKDFGGTTDFSLMFPSTTIEVLP